MTKDDSTELARRPVKGAWIMNDNDVTLQELPELSALKQAALSYVTEAFAEAELDGLDADCMAQAALFAAFTELVTTYGEDAVAEYAATLPDKIRTGAFSMAVALKH
jgi:hypothetical protein